MTMRCPRCHWYFRKIDKDSGLYECSNPICNCILQTPEVVKRKQQPQQTLTEDKPITNEEVIK